jgi:hypothetical protein
MKRLYSLISAIITSIASRHGIDPIPPLFLTYLLLPTLTRPIEVLPLSTFPSRGGEQDGLRGEAFRAGGREDQRFL